VSASKLRYLPSSSEKLPHSSSPPLELVSTLSTPSQLDSASRTLPVPCGHVMDSGPREEFQALPASSALGVAPCRSPTIPGLFFSLSTPSLLDSAAKTLPYAVTSRDGRCDNGVVPRSVRLLLAAKSFPLAVPRCSNSIFTLSTPSRLYSASKTLPVPCGRVERHWHPGGVLSSVSLLQRVQFLPDAVLSPS